MSYAKSYLHTTVDIDDLLSEVVSVMSAAGWSTYDDQSGASPPYVIMSSDGESGNEPIVYVRLHTSSSANKFYIQALQTWDAVAHTGSNPYYGPTLGGAGYLTVTDAGGDVIHVYASKDYVILYIEGVSVVTFAGVYLAENFLHGAEVFATTSDDITPNATETLNYSLTTGLDESNAAALFEVGRPCQLISYDDSYRYVATIESINTDDNEITFDYVPYAPYAYTFPTGSKVGVMPWKWIVVGPSGQYATNTTDGYSSVSSPNVSLTNIFNGYRDYVQNVPMLRCQFAQIDSKDIILKQHDDFKRVFNDSVVTFATRDTVTFNHQDSGTATSGAATTLTDSGASWVTDAYNDYVVVITGGTGAGQIRTITDTSSNQLTVPAWDTNPDNSSDYIIAEKAYRIMAQSTYYIAQREC